MAKRHGRRGQGLRRGIAAQERLGARRPGLGGLITGDSQGQHRRGVFWKESQAVHGVRRFPRNVPHDHVGHIDVQRQEGVIVPSDLPHHGKAQSLVQHRRQPGPREAVPANNQYTEQRHLVKPLGSPTSPTATGVSSTGVTTTGVITGR